MTFSGLPGAESWAGDSAGIKRWQVNDAGKRFVAWVRRLVARADTAAGGGAA